MRTFLVQDYGDDVLFANHENCKLILCRGVQRITLYDRCVDDSGDSCDERLS